ncbi:GNAT family N-acetyltransferase [Leifsonia sp. AG29]|uniref:GNAT family N-acetyltransferase n=1 Tax=Leifsonia sp. AG29 TaxID=2598860 RepID=UPI00131C3090|nr:GNAT family N-acetyltransferase [Leifsonia sp. AG29]
MADGLPSERFEPEVHDASEFTCGVNVMDAWLRDNAADAARRRTSTTWVWADDSRVVAYYSLSGHKVARGEVPRDIGRGGPQEIPAVLIGKLALDQSRQGQGLGGLLLADALTRFLAATQIVAARLVVVDALDDDVARYYEHYGFDRVPGSLRLVRRVSSIEADFGGTLPGL